MTAANSKSIDPLKVRRASVADVEVIQTLIDEYATGHPAERHPRPRPVIEAAYFGTSSASFILIATKRGEPVGFGAWRKVFDMFWAKPGGEMDGLYVRPVHRGRGIAISIVAAICADIRSEGGTFLRATYTEDVARLYERVAIGNDQRECHLSASAFQAVADLAGCGARELVRRLPTKRLNYVVPAQTG
jgi:ribosomal protein S18 acetylase RimI-like enzyme